MSTGRTLTLAQVLDNFCPTINFGSLYIYFLTSCKGADIDWSAGTTSTQIKYLFILSGTHAVSTLPTIPHGHKIWYMANICLHEQPELLNSRWNLRHADLMRKAKYGFVSPWPPSATHDLPTALQHAACKEWSPPAPVCLNWLEHWQYFWDSDTLYFSLTLTQHWDKTSSNKMSTYRGP